MAYEPTVWKSGDVITSTKLNKLENGVAEAGGGTGGGVLVVNATSTETEVVLDKTWKEIYDAPFASISMKFDEDLESYKFYVGSVVKNANNTYSVFAFEIGSSFHITGYEFVASSPTDYPVAQMG